VTFHKFILCFKPELLNDLPTRSGAIGEKKTILPTKRKMFSALTLRRSMPDGSETDAIDCRLVN